jgi:hypothetical protein
MFHTVESWDWSGRGRADRRSPGLARAKWASANRQFTLKHGFSRREVIEQLLQHVNAFEKGTRTLIGFDFSFSFPFQAKGDRFVDGSTTWEVFSSTVHRTLQPDGIASQFYGSPADYGRCGFPDHFSHLYIGASNVGPNYIKAYRETENCARQLGCPAASVFRLVNPMAGVQSLAGIYVLREVLQHCIKQHFPLTIWPLGHLDRSGAWHEGTDNWDWRDHGVVMLESYPRLSFHRAAIADRKSFGTAQSVEQAAANLALMPGTITNHEAPETPDERDASIVLMHLLSPAWFRMQVRPDLPPDSIHLQGVTGQPPTVENVAGPFAPPALRTKEGSIFGA